MEYIFHTLPFLAFHLTSLMPFAEKLLHSTSRTLNNLSWDSILNFFIWKLHFQLLEKLLFLSFHENSWIKVQHKCHSLNFGTYNFLFAFNFGKQSIKCCSFVDIGVKDKLMSSSLKFWPSSAWTFDIPVIKCIFLALPWILF